MLSVAILAAGKGTRMESSLPKVLHKISGKSLLQRVIDSCVALKPDQIFVITGHKSKEVQKSVPNDKKIHIVIQEPQSGTGHAIQVLCKEVKKHEGIVLVLNGDVPLIRPSTLKRLFPEILCKTFGIELSILVPFPAANIATLNIFFFNLSINLTLGGQLRHSPLFSPFFCRY